MMDEALVTVSEPVADPAVVSPLDHAQVRLALLSLLHQRREVDHRILQLRLLIGSVEIPSREDWPWHGPCTRCGHTWQGRPHPAPIPRFCARCKSAGWQTEPRSPLARHPSDNPNPRWKARKSVRKPPAAIAAPAEEVAKAAVPFKPRTILPPPPDPDSLSAELLRRASIPKETP